MPSLSITPGRKFSITTSIFGTMRLMTSIALGCLRSMVIERLPALTATQGAARPRFSQAFGAVAEAHVVAFARFDLDDVGAEQRELIGGVRPREDTREVEDLHAGKRLAHLFVIPTEGSRSEA